MGNKNSRKEDSSNPLPASGLRSRAPPDSVIVRTAQKSDGTDSVSEVRDPHWQWELAWAPRVRADPGLLRSHAPLDLTLGRQLWFPLAGAGAGDAFLAWPSSTETSALDQETGLLKFLTQDHTVRTAVDPEAAFTVGRESALLPVVQERDDANREFPIVRLVSCVPASTTEGSWIQAMDMLAPLFDGLVCFREAGYVHHDITVESLVVHAEADRAPTLKFLVSPASGQYEYEKHRAVYGCSDPSLLRRVTVYPPEFGIFTSEKGQPSHLQEGLKQQWVQVYTNRGHSEPVIPMFCEKYESAFASLEYWEALGEQSLFFGMLCSDTAYYTQLNTPDAMSASDVFGLGCALMRLGLEAAPDGGLPEQFVTLLVDMVKPLWQSVKYLEVIDVPPEPLIRVTALEARDRFRAMIGKPIGG